MEEQVELATAPGTTVTELADGARGADGPGMVVAGDGRLWFWRDTDWQWGVTLAGRALTNLGVSPRDRVGVALPNRHQGDALLLGAMAMGAQATASEAVLRSNWPTVLVGEPFQLLGAPWGPNVRLVVVTAGPDSAPGVRARLRERGGPDLAIRQAWWVAAFPGPVALECEAGALHVTEDDFQTAWIPDGEVSILRLERPNQQPVGVRDALTPTTCGCGWPGAAFAAVRDRGPILTAAGRRLFRHDLIDACFRTPGFGDAATLALRYDRGRGRDFLDVEACLEPGWDPRAVREALSYSLALTTKLPIRISLVDRGEAAGVHIVDARA